MILKCTCKHKFQDRAHGKDKRVHNEKKDGLFKCTVCETTRSKK